MASGLAGAGPFTADVSLPASPEGGQGYSLELYGALTLSAVQLETNRAYFSNTFHVSE